MYTLIFTVLLSPNPLIEQLGNESYPLREEATKKLTNKDYILILQLNKKHPDLEVRTRVARILHQIELQDPNRLEILINRLGSKNPHERYDAFYEIWEMGKKGSKSLQDKVYRKIQWKVMDTPAYIGSDAVWGCFPKINPKYANLCRLLNCLGGEHTLPCTNHFAVHDYKVPYMQD